MYFDPLKCKSLTTSKKEGVYWIGRLDKMKVRNQIILLFGFIYPSQESKQKGKNHVFPESQTFIGKQFTLKMSVNIRAKNKKEEKWNNININAKETVNADCKAVIISSLTLSLRTLKFATNLL